MVTDIDLPEVDYTIHDIEGITGVKGDRKFPITEEQWRRMHPEHKTTGCAKCRFAENYDGIVNLVSDKSRRRALRGKVVSIGLFTMPNWIGHINFYLFKCPDCKNITANYPPGDGDFVRCTHCHRGRVSIYGRISLILRGLREFLLILLLFLKPQGGARSNS